MRFLFFIFGGMVADEKEKLKARYDWDWDIKNNCGPRPQGPMYPVPPAVDASAIDVRPCDILPNSAYVFDYECEAPCQMDKSRIVKLICQCFLEVGIVKKIIPCKWTYKEDISCPEVPSSDKFDWECDPRETNCPDAQYNWAKPVPSEPKPMVADPEMYDPEIETVKSEPGVVSSSSPNLEADLAPRIVYDYDEELARAGGGKGAARPIIISPVLTQKVGDITANGSNSTDYVMPRPDKYTAVNHYHQPYVPYDFDEHKDKLEEKAAALAEMNEKVRGLQSQISVVQESQEREELKTSQLLKSKATEFARDREELLNEKTEIISLYKAMLHTKERELQETMDEIRKLRKVYTTPRTSQPVDLINGNRMKMTQNQMVAESNLNLIQGGAAKWPNLKLARSGLAQLNRWPETTLDRLKWEQTQTNLNKLAQIKHLEQTMAELSKLPTIDNLYKTQDFLPKLSKNARKRRNTNGEKVGK